MAAPALRGNPEVGTSTGSYDRLSSGEGGDSVPSEMLGLDQQVVDAENLEKSLERCRSGGIALPTFAQLASPALIPSGVFEALAGVDPDAADPLNLFRVH